MNITKFTTDRQGADVDGNLRLIPSGDYKTWMEGGFYWLDFNGEKIRWKSVSDPTSVWSNWGKYSGSDNSGDSSSSTSVEKWIMWGGVLLLLATGFYPLAILLAFVAILYQNLTDEDKRKNIYKWIIGIVIAIIAYTLIFKKRK